MDHADYVAALEKQNRLLRIVAASSFAACVIGVACAATTLQERLVINDRNGTNRIDVGVNGNGRSNGVSLNDADGRRKVNLTITDEGDGVLTLVDRNGNVSKYP